MTSTTALGLQPHHNHFAHHIRSKAWGIEPGWKFVNRQQDQKIFPDPLDAFARRSFRAKDHPIITTESGLGRRSQSRERSSSAPRAGFSRSIEIKLVDHHPGLDLHWGSGGGGGSRPEQERHARPPALAPTLVRPFAAAALPKAHDHVMVPPARASPPFPEPASTVVAPRTYFSTFPAAQKPGQFAREDFAPPPPAPIRASHAHPEMTHTALSRTLSGALPQAHKPRPFPRDDFAPPPRVSPEASHPLVFRSYSATLPQAHKPRHYEVGPPARTSPTAFHPEAALAHPAHPAAHPAVARSYSATLPQAYRPRPAGEGHAAPPRVSPTHTEVIPPGVLKKPGSYRGPKSMKKVAFLDNAEFSRGIH